MVHTDPLTIRGISKRNQDLDLEYFRIFFHKKLSLNCLAPISTTSYITYRIKSVSLLLRRNTKRGMSLIFSRIGTIVLLTAPPAWLNHLFLVRSL